jgi:hypothetical protein
MFEQHEEDASLPSRQVVSHDGTGVHQRLTTTFKAVVRQDAPILHGLLAAAYGDAAEEERNIAVVRSAVDE